MVYGKGIQRVGELVRFHVAPFGSHSRQLDVRRSLVSCRQVDLGTKFGLLKRSGAWYSYAGTGTACQGCCRVFIFSYCGLQGSTLARVVRRSALERGRVCLLSSCLVCVPGQGVL